MWAGGGVTPVSTSSMDYWMRTPTPEPAKVSFYSSEMSERNTFCGLSAHWPQRWSVSLAVHSH